MAPYESSSKIVLGIDIGTTSTGVALAHLAPGATPSIRSVQKWPGAPNESKIPSLVYVLSNGTPIAFGAECTSADIKARAKSSGSLVQYFKTHLHPISMQFDATATLASSMARLAANDHPIVPDCTPTPLPHGITIETIYSSFLKYLVAHTKAWFCENTFGGPRIWDKVEIHYAMAIPDGWDDTQQVILRRCFVAAGLLVDETEERLEFIREAEASVHFALQAEDVRQWLIPGACFTVADLGGSTVDVGMYRCDSVKPCVRIREVKVSDSVQAGGVYVDRAARTLLESKLARSKFGNGETIDKMIQVFESYNKRTYGASGDQSPSIIKFGTPGDQDRAVGIAMGRLTLTSDEVQKTFAFCEKEIIASIKSQIKMGTSSSSHVIITGGFGESPYLQRRLREELSSSAKVVTGDEPTKKAVAEGAVAWSIEQLCLSRAVRATYGIEFGREYHAHDSEDRERAHASYVELDGTIRMKGAFSTLVRAGTVMESTKSLDQQYCFTYSTPALGTRPIDIFVYEGSDASPRWIEDPEGRRLPDFVKKCTVKADLQPLLPSLTPLRLYSHHPATSNDLASGRAYWRVDFSIKLFLAETCLKARMTWMDKGVLQEGPATVVIDEAIDRVGLASVRRRTPADTIVRPR